MHPHPYADALDVLMEVGGARLVRAPARRRVLRALRQIFPAYAPSTQRNLRLACRDFLTFCIRTARTAFPASRATLLLYINDLAARVGSDSVAQRVGALSLVHRTASFPDPALHPQVALALRRTVLANPPRRHQAAPLSLEQVRMISARPPRTLADLRDRALLLVARDALARRSELIPIDVEHITPLEDGSAILQIRRAKVTIGNPMQPVWLSPETMTVLKAWLSAAEITSGAVFRAVQHSGKLGRRLCKEHVSRAYRRLAQAAGLDTKGISSHSSRVGAVQDLVSAGLGVPLVMQAGGWRSPQNAQRYTALLDARKSAVARLNGTSPLKPD